MSNCNLQLWIHLLTFIGGISIEVGFSYLEFINIKFVMKGYNIMEIVKILTFELVHCARGVNDQL